MHELNEQGQWSLGDQPRILLLSQLPIGDTLFTTPTVRAIRQRYPNAYIAAVCHRTTAPLLKCVPEIDEVLVLPFRSDWQGLGPLLDALGVLRRRRFDAAVTFTTPAYKWVSMLAGIRRRAYMKFDPAWWFLPGDHRRWKTTHATRHYYDCARELDLPRWQAIDHVPRISLPGATHDAAQMWLAGQGVVRDGRPLVGLHAGGAGIGGLKRWPASRFAELADRLAAEWEARIVLVGGPDERELAAEVARRTQCAEPLVAAGALPLLTSAALIGACDLFVGNDSSPLHLAAALGTPYIGIFGATQVANFRPQAVRPHQGRLALPRRPCLAPYSFVGGTPIWGNQCCGSVCAALNSIAVDEVYGLAEGLLRGRFSIPVGAA